MAIKDYSLQIGGQYGQLTILDIVTVKGNGHALAVCKCVCGKVFSPEARSIAKGQKSCGCMPKVGSTPVDVGDKFGRLTVISLKIVGHRTRAVCLCECGCSKTTIPYSLTSGMTKSCGCLSNEKARERFVTHGDTIGGATTEYRRWQGMIKRCTNPSNAKFKHYGGRGIKVCERWFKFENFLADMGRAPPRTSIDRINNDGNYEPGNCAWRTFSEQARNRRVAVKITFNGVTRLMIEWAEITGFKYATLKRRLKHGWSPEEILTTPLGNQPNVSNRSLRKSRSTT